MKTARPAWRTPSELFFVVLVILTLAVSLISDLTIRNARLILFSGEQSRVDLDSVLELVIVEDDALRAYALSGYRATLSPYVESQLLYPRRLSMLRHDLSGPSFVSVRPHVDRIDALHAEWTRSVAQVSIGHLHDARAKIMERNSRNLIVAIRIEIDESDAAIRNVIYELRDRTRVTVLGSTICIVLLTVALGTAALWSERSRLREERRLRAQISEYVKALERSNHHLEEFAYVASHDLQEPLRTITNFTQLLQKRYTGQLNAEANEFIAHTIDGATRMRALIDDILQYSRVTTHGKPFEILPLDVPVRRALAQLRMTIEERRAVIDLAALPLVRGDSTQLTQLFQNLIGNAVKYNVQNPPRVEIDALGSNGEAVVRVRDNGIGIAAGDQERIFRIFSRLHTRTEYPGTGIGLALCRRIVERHGGRIWVESAEGNGATFSFTLQTTEEHTA